MNKTCLYEMIERLFNENDVPMRTLDLITKPVFRLQDVLESAHEKDPLKMSQELED